MSIVQEFDVLHPASGEARRLHGGKIAHHRRLRCSVMDGRLGKNVPEVRAFEAAMEGLTEALATQFYLRGVEPGNILYDEGQGSLWTRSANGPPSKRVYRMALPADEALRRQMLSTVLTYLTRARRVLPQAAWEVELGGCALAWDAKRGVFRTELS